MLLTYLQPIKEHTYFYHTTSWRTAISIMKYGIEHYSGRENLDFGTTPGFYLAENLHIALKWGNRNYNTYSNEIATLIFSIPNNTRVLHLTGDDWIHVTRMSKRCDDYDCRDDKLMKTIHRSDLVYGNILGNPSQVRFKDVKPAPLGNMNQLVSKTDNGDEILHKCLVGCFFFSAAAAAAN